MITGIDITKIQADRNNREMISNMKFNINFEDVKVEKDSVDVKFTFSAIYEGGANNEKEVGKLTITGNIMSKESKKEADDIESTWKSKKTLPVSFAEDIINMLNFECGSRGTLVAYSIGFVAPLPITRAKLQEGNSGKSGAA